MLNLTHARFSKASKNSNRARLAVSAAPGSSLRRWLALANNLSTSFFSLPMSMRRHTNSTCWNSSLFMLATLPEELLPL